MIEDNELEQSGISENDNTIELGGNDAVDFSVIEDEVNRQKERQQAREAEINQNLETLAQQSFRNEYNAARLRAKTETQLLINEYSKNPAADAKLKSILSSMQEFANIEATAANMFSFGKEKRILANAVSMLDQYIKNIEDQEDKNKSAEIDNELLQRHVMAENLRVIVKNMTNGNLVVPNDKKVVDNLIRDKVTDMNVLDDFKPSATDHFVNATSSDISGSIINTAHLNDPLFPHDPCPEDLEQLMLGDCYLLSGLASVAKNKPEVIKDMMVDNGDGTVTVRLWGRKPFSDDNAEFYRPMEPVYVTVDKVSPTLSSAQNCLWAQVIERAYVASGMHIANAVSGDIIPPNIDKLYKDYSKLKPNELPTHAECPWLISPDGKLHKWEPSYAQIEGGYSNEFLEHVLGSEYNALTLTPGGIEAREIERAINQGSSKQNYGRDTCFNAIKRLLETKNPERVKTFTEMKANDMAKMLYEYGEGEPATNEDGTFVDSDRFYKYVDFMNSVIRNGVYSDENMRGLSVEDLVKPSYQIAKQGIEKNDYSFLMAGPEKEAFDNVEDEKGKIKGLKERHQDIINKVEANVELSEKEKKDYDYYLGRLAVHTQSLEENIKKLEEARKTQPSAANDPKMQKLARELVESLEKEVAMSVKKPRSGVYDDTEERIYKAIEDSIKGGALVNWGTLSEDEDIPVNGLVSGHAYTVANVFEDKSREPHVKFVRVRNPHGNNSNGVGYSKDENGNLTTTNTIKAPGGYTDIELGDFIKSTSQIYFNGKMPKSVLELSSVNPYAKPDPKSENVMDAESYKQYYNAMQLFKQKLNDSSSILSFDSDEYKKMFEQINLPSSVHPLYPISHCGNMYGHLEKATNKYITHCKENEKSGDRRALRLQTAKAMKTMMGLMKAGVKRPVDYIKNKIVEKYLKGVAANLAEQGKTALSERITSNIKDLAANMMKNGEFKEFFESKDIAQLCEIHEIPEAKSKEMVKDYFEKLSTSAQTELDKQNENPEIANNEINNNEIKKDDNVKIKNIVNEEDFEEKIIL